MAGMFKDWMRDSVGRDRFMHPKILYEAQRQGKKATKEFSMGYRATQVMSDFEYVIII